MPDTDCTQVSSESGTKRMAEGVYITPLLTDSLVQYCIVLLRTWYNDYGTVIIRKGYTSRWKNDRPGWYRSIEFLGVYNNLYMFNICTKKESGWWWLVFEWLFGDILTKLEETYAILKKSASELVYWIKTPLEAKYSILTKTGEDIYALIEPYLPDIPDFPDLDDWFTEQKDKVVDWVAEKFEEVLDKVFKR